MKGHRIVLTAVAALGFVTGSAQTQDTRCAACLTFVPIAELSTAEAPIVPSTVQSVLRTSNHGFLISHLFSGQPQLALYDSAGDFIWLYGRAGGGPGEFRRAPRLYSGPGNTVWAVEDDRLTRLDENLRHLETRRLEHRIAGERTVVRNGYAVVNRMVLGPSGWFRSLTLLDSVATVVEELEAETDHSRIAVLSPAASGGFWALRSNELLLRRYSNNGDLVDTIPIVIDSFEPWEPDAETSQGADEANSPPPPAHVAVFEPGDDLLVVLTITPSDDWTARPADRMFRPSEIDYNQPYDTFASLVDLRTGRSIVSKQFPDYLHVVDGASDLAYSVRQDSLGHVTTTILQVEARRP